MKDQIELPPLLPHPRNQASGKAWTEPEKEVIRRWGIAAIEAYRQRGNAKRRYDEIMKDDTEEPDPIEDLRFYCSIAMSGQDWLDVEPFFDALIAYRQRRGEPVAVVGSVYQLLWAGNGDFPALIKRHELKPGSKLYAAPVAAQPQLSGNPGELDAALKTAEAFNADIPVTDQEEEEWKRLEDSQ